MSRDRKRKGLADARRRRRQEVKRIRDEFNAAMRAAKADRRVELTEFAWWERNRPPGY